MKLETGKPLVEGLYLVFVPAVVKSWLEPHIVMWHKGAWHFRSSTEKYPDTVETWAGPLPVIRANPRGDGYYQDDTRERMADVAALLAPLEHVFYRCPQPCEKQNCVYCDGGLSYCTVCRKGEGELEKVCPGEPPLEFDL